MSVAVAVVFAPSAIFAYQVQDLPGAEIKNDFVLGPGKIEITGDRGQKAAREMYITNRTSKSLTFKIEIEDFIGSRNPEETVVLLGDQKGPYSLKDYIHPEISEFTLKSKQRMILPVQITVPEDAQPGGLYGTLLISTVPSPDEIQKEAGMTTGGNVNITRLGSLIFVRVKGDVKEEGALKSMVTPKGKFFQSGPIVFDLLYENTGNVYLNPYGIIEIKNIFGKKIDEIKVDPWFAMPDSLRLRELKWGEGKKMLMGMYTAHASINRGYQNIIDKADASFWVFPWKILLAGFGALLLVIFFFKWIFSKVEFRIKK